MNKPFDKDLYDQDDAAKHLIIDWLGRNNITAWVNPDDYGIDLLSESGESYEVEVKHNWTGSKFPYTEVHFSARKLKFANLYSRFIMLNHELTHALIVSGYEVRHSPIITKSTIYTENEQFIEVDLSQCKMVELNE